MHLEKFVAADMPSALAAVKAALGPDAVVVAIRRRPRRVFWRRPQLEVTATRAERSQEHAGGNRDASVLDHDGRASRDARDDDAERDAPAGRTYARRAAAARARVAAEKIEELADAAKFVSMSIDSGIE